MFVNKIFGQKLFCFKIVFGQINFLVVTKIWSIKLTWSKTFLVGRNIFWSNKFLDEIFFLVKNKMFGCKKYY